jgi:anaphase-promoting complex subunit 5
LAFLKTRAKEAEMWSLLNTSLLSEAKVGLQNVSSAEN